jgi:DNA-binding GntR family transcriptional regulator
MSLHDVKEPVVEGRSLTLIAYERIRADVLRCELRPGERLRVQALSQRYRTGTTSIREALSRLVSEDLVLFEEQRGFLVSPVSSVDLIDLTEARIDLESIALTRAIQFGDTGWEAELMACMHRLTKCAVPEDPRTSAIWSREHKAFHEALLAGCASPWIRAMCRLLYDKSERYRCLARLRPSERQVDLRTQRQHEHNCLMASALDRSPQQACEELARHYRRTTELVLAAIGAAGLFDDKGSSPRL